MWRRLKRRPVKSLTSAEMIEIIDKDQQLREVYARLYDQARKKLGRMPTRQEARAIKRGTLKTKVTMERENGELVCCGVLAGTGVMLNET